MTANLISQAASASEILNELSVRIYQPAFSSVRDDLALVPEALRNVILFIDFDTEVNMGGILAFLENSSGAYLSETIEAFEAIGAFENSGQLAKIRDIIESFGISHERLRQGFEEFEEYEITTFEKTHGAEFVPFADAVQMAARTLYLYGDTTEDLSLLLKRYVEQHREEILAVINNII